MLSLSNSVRQLKNEQNPSPRAVSGSNTPRPMRTSTARWVSRKVRIYKQVPTTSVSAEVTYGDVAKLLTTTGTVSVRADGAQVWNVTNTARTSNYVSVTFSPNLFYSGVDATVANCFEDWGGASGSPSVRVDLPKALTTDLSLGVSSTTNFATVAVSPNAAVVTSEAQTVVLDLYLLVKNA